MHQTIDYEKVGNRLRVERENFNMTREALAELIGISPYFLGQIERGERKMSIKTLTAVSQCLHISIDYLIYGSDSTWNNNDDDLYSLLRRCSDKEINVFKTIIKVLLPHLNRQEEQNQISDNGEVG